MAVSRDPSALIAELNDIFAPFDRAFVVTEVGLIEEKHFGRVLVHVIEDESGRGKTGP